MPKVVVKNLTRSPQQAVLADRMGNIHTRTIPGRGDIVVDESAVTPELTKRASAGPNRVFSLSLHRA